MNKRLIPIVILMLMLACGCRREQTQQEILQTGEPTPLASMDGTADVEESSTAEEEVIASTVVDATTYEYYDWGGQRVDVYLYDYFGSWIVGEQVGLGYVYPDIDPEKEIFGGVLDLQEDRAVFTYPDGRVVELNNPTYITWLENRDSFTSHRRASYASFDFHNSYVVRVDIYQEDKFWGPITILYLKDVDTLVADHNVYHNLTRFDD